MWSEQKHTTGGYVENKAFPSPYLYGIWTMWTYVNVEYTLCIGVDGVAFYYTPCCVETPGFVWFGIFEIVHRWMEHPMLIKGWTKQTKKFFVSHGKVYDE